MKNALLTGALAISLGAGAAPAAEPGIQLGVLTCQMTDQTNLILYTNLNIGSTYFVALLTIIILGLVLYIYYRSRED